ncbi:MAG TPA: hypothetical protein VKV73_03770 [Chloroflexota bacterium]|nr:hypothetical protein [Chloroflexota bacterium]
MRIAVVVADLFEAASAIIGAVGLVVGFMGIPVSILSGTPFTDFTVPALLLGFVVGGSALIAAVIAAYALGPRHFDALASVAAGCITVGWLTVEIAMIGLASWAQVVWWLAGVVMIGLAALLWQAESHAAGVRGMHPRGVGGSHQPI